MRAQNKKTVSPERSPVSKPDRDVLIALAAVGFSLLALLAWIPFDIESGILEKHRRTVYIGDAMLPTLCAGLMLLCSLGLLAGSLFRRRKTPADSVGTAASGATAAAKGILSLQIKILILMVLSLVVLFYLGSIAVWLAGTIGIETGSYRELRDTVPWKYLGFITGGSILVGGLISLIENRFRMMNIAIGIMVSLLLILIFDLPFEDLLLPPNGDF